MCPRFADVVGQLKLIWDFCYWELKVHCQFFLFGEGKTTWDICILFLCSVWLAFLTGLRPNCPLNEEKDKYGVCSEFHEIAMETNIFWVVFGTFLALSPVESRIHKLHLTVILRSLFFAHLLFAINIHYLYRIRKAQWCHYLRSVC